ncbi:unnamed protein product, partial [Rangifer tarandus platyrhynchus]
TKKKSTNKWQMTLCFNAGDRKRSDDNSGKLKEEHASSEGAATLQLFAASLVWLEKHWCMPGDGTARETQTNVAIPDFLLEEQHTWDSF